MGKGLDEFRQLRDDGVDYARLKWASWRLEAVDRISVSLSKVFGRALFIVLLFIAVAFFAVALALWLGELLGHTSYGFLILGGVLAVAAVLLLFFGGRMVIDSLVKHLIEMFFPVNDDDDGTEE